MTNRIRTGIALLMLSHGLVGCADQGSPTAPSATPPPSVQQPSPQPTGIQPSVTAIAPQVGSTRGGAWATITGVDFQPGAKVRLGDTTVSSWTRDSTTIAIWETAAHAAGTIDVIVTNPGGLEARLSGGYTYEQPESFDFNGDWVAHAGPEFETDMRFTIRNNVLVSISCGTSAPLAFAPAPSVRNGEFSFLGDDGLAISGTLAISAVANWSTMPLSRCAWIFRLTAMPAQTTATMAAAVMADLAPTRREAAAIIFRCGVVQPLLRVSVRMLAHSKNPGSRCGPGLAFHSCENSSSRISARPRAVSRCFLVSHSRSEGTR